MFEREFFFFGVNLDNVHWGVVIAHVPQRKIYWYDGMDMSTGTTYIELVRSYLRREEKLLTSKEPTEFRVANITDLNGGCAVCRQMNGNDCGVLALTVMDYVADQTPIPSYLSEADAITMRYKICLSMIAGSVTRAGSPPAIVSASQYEQLMGITL
jgi:Ulp1 family protease